MLKKLLCSLALCAAAFLLLGAAPPPSCHGPQCDGPNDPCGYYTWYGCISLCPCPWSTPSTPHTPCRVR